MEDDESVIVTEDNNNQEGIESEVAPALISFHPAHHSVALAVGSDLRFFSLREGCSITLGDESNEVCHHKESIRAIRYGAKGKFFVSAGDDKVVKIWDADLWRCLYTVFVSCLALIYNQDCPQGYLVSGSGDSTVHLWDFSSGLLLHTCEVGSQVSNMPGFNSSSLARVRVISSLSKCSLESSDDDYKILEDKKAPCGEQLLHGSLSIDKDVFSAAAEAVKTSMQNLLIKKQYSSERRDFRKRGRNNKAKR